MASRGYCRLSFQYWVRLQDCSNDLISLQVTSTKSKVKEGELVLLGLVLVLVLDLPLLRLEMEDGLSL